MQLLVSGCILLLDAQKHAKITEKAYDCELVLIRAMYSSSC